MLGGGGGGQGGEEAEARSAPAHSTTEASGEPDVANGCDIGGSSPFFPFLPFLLSPLFLAPRGCNLGAVSM